MKIVVFGAGRMGFGAAFDLLQSDGVRHVTLADINLEQAQHVVGKLRFPGIKPQIDAVKVDVHDQNDVVKVMREHDAAISCVVYRYNLGLARAAIEAGIHFCDLGGNDHIVAQELALDEEAKAAGITIIPDCGLAPGMVSILAAHGVRRFERLNSLKIRVGGLPQKPRSPMNYQIVFSVEGLINEYIEPVHILENARKTTVEPMTGLESLEFPPPFGRMEAFYTSGGASTLPETFAGKINTLDYKTIRFPGHCEQFRLLMDLGFTDNNVLSIEGKQIAPRKVLEALMVQSLSSTEPDVVLVRLIFSGIMQGQNQTLHYDIIDYHDEGTGLSAMMRTTSFPASIIAQMMVRGDISRTGAIPQERCVPPDIFVQELSQRNIHISEYLDRQ